MLLKDGREVEKRCCQQVAPEVSGSKMGTKESRISLMYVKRGLEVQEPCSYNIIVVSMKTGLNGNNSHF